MHSLTVRVALFLLCGLSQSGNSAEPHWSYRPPQVRRLPEVRNTRWPRNGIDHFVLRRLENNGLRPSREADRTTLIRRVTLDLTGIPPTPAEVDAFVADRAPDAYERVVDRLLRSPAYAERMTAWWLDLARYADTHGYEGDGSRNIWLFRDWVIHAFAQGMPFDRFTIEQIAGDLLPQATAAQQIATGFHRNSPFCYEGGTDLEQFRVEAVIDRVNTTMTVWMGTTFGCAQCHDHKYDPFTQRDYYQVYAFFNNSTESRGATLSAASPLARGKLASIHGQIEQLQKRIRSTNIVARQRAWEAALNRVYVRKLAPHRYESLNGAKLSRLKDGSILAGGKNPSSDVYELEIRWPGGTFASLGLEVLHHSSLPKGGPGRYESNGNFGLSKIEFEIQRPRQTKWQPLSVKSATATYSDRQDLITNALRDGKPCWCTNQQEAQAWFHFKEAVKLPAGTRLRVRMKQQSKWQRHGIGRFRLWSAGRFNFAAPLPPLDVVLIGQTPMHNRTAAQSKRLADHFRLVVPDLMRYNKRIKALQASVPRSSTMVMKERSTPRTTKILIGGDFQTPGKVVTPNVPAPLHNWQRRFPRNRHGLAQWLVDPANPLVARVTMNRIWALLLGRGIVKTSEDFGTQGSRPTHPLLLDHLAVEFVRSGWNIQAMQKRIVLSATYRQSSNVTPQLLKIDATNRLYSRGPAHRLDAEAIRDNALAISGLLHHRLGGPGVYPIQPNGIYEQIHSYTTKWPTSQQGQQFRRGLYTWWKRTAPYPSMITFDAPRRNVCTERRPRTNTPLQALVTLNDPVFVQCAASLARRMQHECKGDVAHRLQFGFRLCVGRKPRQEELAELTRLHRQAMEIYRRKPKEAKALANSGLTSQSSDTSPAAMAAWTLVANVLLNLDETLCKY